MRAAKGESGLIEPSFVYCPGVEGGDAVAKETGCDYFSVPVELGTDGVKSVHNVIGSTNDYEKKLLEKCYEGLKKNITAGTEFIKNPPSK